MQLNQKRWNGPKVHTGKGKLIGRGKVARVYRIEGKPHSLIRKEFSPIYPVKIWNWFFYKSLHPLSTESGYKYAYWKRRIAHRLCRYLDTDVRITDALELLRRGFTAHFIDGRLPARRKKRAVHAAAKKLEDFFDYVGMPTWSFSRRNPFALSNFLILKDAIYIIDYEQSVPVPDSKGRIDYDGIYFEDTHDFIHNNRRQILDKLGKKEMQYLDEAIELAKKYHGQLDIRPKRITKFVSRRKKK